MTGGDRLDPPGDSSSDPLLGGPHVRRRIEASVPEHPTAWLPRAARNRAIDHLRREQRGGALIGDYGREIARSHLARSTPQFSDNARHDALALLFIACHPILSADTRCALALRIIGGLDNAALARAFLVPEATIAQRIVRGKRKLAEAKIRFEMPSAAECRERLGSVREVIYQAQAAAQFDDPARVLAALDAAVDARKLDSHVPLHAVRGDLLERCGERAAAATAFRLAAEHSGNDAEQRLLLGRAQRAEAVPGAAKRQPRR